jgi:hypothetical protein
MQPTGQGTGRFDSKWASRQPVLARLDCTPQLASLLDGGASVFVHVCPVAGRTGANMFRLPWHSLLADKLGLGVLPGEVGHHGLAGTLHAILDNLDLLTRRR